MQEGVPGVGFRHFIADETDDDDEKRHRERQKKHVFVGERRERQEREEDKKKYLVEQGRDALVEEISENARPTGFNFRQTAVHPRGVELGAVEKTHARAGRAGNFGEFHVFHDLVFDGLVSSQFFVDFLFNQDELAVRQHRRVPVVVGFARVKPERKA